MKNIELLAPAGTIESMEAAFNHGADAVYMGIGPYNLRVNASAISFETFYDGLISAHSQGKKLYAVLNTMPNQQHMESIEDLIKRLSQQMPELPDALIVSDPGVLVVCQQYCGETIPVHLSTQTGTFNLNAMRFWNAQGIKRVILPREMTLSQISQIAQAGICETEIFVHGAMCVSVAGRCLLSAYLNERHANHGDCSQPCRFEYSITPCGNSGKDKQESDISVVEDEQGVYLLNSKDLNAMPLFADICKTGVSALKIEGRNKTAHYVASVVKAYRQALDAFLTDPEHFVVDPQWLELLESCDHRTYTTGFYGKEHMLQDVVSTKAQQQFRLVGIVKGVLESSGAVIDVKNPFCTGSTVSVLPVNRKKAVYQTTVTKITDICGNVVDRALTNRIVVVYIDSDKLRIGDMLRVKEVSFNG